MSPFEFCHRNSGRSDAAEKIGRGRTGRSRRLKAHRGQIGRDQSCRGSDAVAELLHGRAVPVIQLEVAAHRAIEQQDAIGNGHAGRIESIRAGDLRRAGSVPRPQTGLPGGIEAVEQHLAIVERHVLRMESAHISSGDGDLGRAAWCSVRLPQPDIAAGVDAAEQRLAIIDRKVPGIEPAGAHVADAGDLCRAAGGSVRQPQPDLAAGVDAAEQRFTTVEDGDVGRIQAEARRRRSVDAGQVGLGRPVGRPQPIEAAGLAAEQHLTVEDGEVARILRAAGHLVRAPGSPVCRPQPGDPARICALEQHPAVEDRQGAGIKPGRTRPRDAGHFVRAVGGPVRHPQSGVAA